MRGLFITIEGPDGAGKSTQAKLLGDFFLNQGRQVIFTREPGGTDISEQIRAVLLRPENQAMTVTTELLLYAAARSQHVDQVIKPAREQGKIIICDRFVDSTVAYQGYGRGIDLALINQLNNLATRGVEPDLTIILDLPVQEGLARVKARSGNEQPDRLEQELADFHERVRQGFMDIARQQPKRCILVEAMDGFKEVHAQIVQAMKAKLQEI